MRKEPETVEHLLFFCHRAQFFGMEFRIWSVITLHPLAPSTSKMFYYEKSVMKNKPLSLKSLLIKIIRTYEIEHFLARQKDLLKYHYERREPLLPIMSDLSFLQYCFHPESLFVI